MAEYEVSNEINVAKIVSKEPYTYKSLLKPTEVQLSSVKKYPFKVGKQYSFDIAMVNQIFDFMLVNSKFDFHIM